MLRRSPGKTVETAIFNVLSWGGYLGYFANVTVGNPPQPQTLVVSTAFSDTYLIPANAYYCGRPNTVHPYGACPGGWFDSNTTDSIVSNTTVFNFPSNYGDMASGRLVFDDFSIGDMLVSGAGFALADNLTGSRTGTGIGMLGPGYWYNEAFNQKQLYPNILEVLVRANAINSALYSLYLGSAEHGSGSLLFGGIDRTKYKGSLTTLNILRDTWNGKFRPRLGYPVTVITDATVTSGNVTHTIWSGGYNGVSAYNDSDSLPVALDTAFPAWKLPTARLRKVLQALPYTSIDSPRLSCKNVTAGDVITLTFGGKSNITFEVSQFIVPLIDRNTRAPERLEDGSHACVLMLADGGNDFQGPYTFGSAFLRNMYVVFDLDNGQISIAQAELDVVDSSNIIEVPAGLNGIAQVVSDVMTASSNTMPHPSAPSAFTVWPDIPSHTASTLATPLGTASGEAAIPFRYRTTSVIPPGWGPQTSGAYATSFSLGLGVEGPTTTSSAGVAARTHYSSHDPLQGVAGGMAVCIALGLAL